MNEKIFADLLLSLDRWSRGHCEVLRSYAFLGKNRLNILICTRGEEYRFDFDDAITDLDIRIARDYADLTTEVMQVPEGAIAMGFNPESVRRGMAEMARGDGESIEAILERYLKTGSLDPLPTTGTPMLSTLSTLLRTAPFRPFAIILNDGRAITIHAPHLAILTPTVIAVGQPSPDVEGGASHIEHVEINYIDHIDAI